MKKTIAILTCCLFCLVAQASLEVGKTYSVKSQKFPAKSLFCKNSSYEIGAEIVLWTETDVPSSQWSLVYTGDSAFALQSVYSGYYATPRSQKVGGSLRLNRVLNNSKLVFIPVDEEEGIFHIMSRDSTLYLTVQTGKDGETPVWSEKIDDSDCQIWKMEEVEPKPIFTAAMRDEMVDNYLKKFAKRISSSSRTFSYGGWGESEQLEVVLDAYESTGNEEYLKMATYVYNYFNSHVGNSWDKLVYKDAYKWYGHDFNDDVMWQIIAVARLGWLTGNKSYTNVAKKNFDVIYKRAYIPFTGMMRWAENSGDRYGTNSCSTGPTEVAACYLGMSGCGEEYFEKARDLYSAQRKIMTNNMSTGKIWDSVVWDPETETVKSKNEWSSTYNQGTMLGAACLLYDHYGDEQYLRDAKKIVSYTKTSLCNSKGVITACQNNDGDLCGFKGILMRYVRRFVLDLNQPDYKAWLLTNAMHSYCNRTVEGVTASAWLTKSTPETASNPFSCSTAVSAAVNAVLGDVVKNGFDTLQIEKFDYHCGLSVIDEEGRGNNRVANVTDGCWVKYDNVDFGEDTARSISIDISPLASNITRSVEVYFDKMEGTPACVIEPNELDTAQPWYTLFADITPTTGLHHVYVRFNCSNSRAKSKVDQIRFFTEQASELETAVKSISDDITPEADAPVSYYDLSGRRLHDAPPAGYYIMQKGNQSRTLMKR